MKRIFTFAILFTLSFSALSAEITGMFSSYKVGESGDLTGMEIHIVPNPIGYTAVVHGSEGAPGFPETLEISILENDIAFTVPDGSGSGLAPGKWKGRVTVDALQLEGPHRNYVLPRKQSFWQ